MKFKSQKEELQNRKTKNISLLNFIELISNNYLWLLLFIGGFLLTNLGAISILDTRSFLRNSISTKATVTDFKQQFSKRSKNNRYVNKYYPIVKFTTSSGDSQIIEFTEGNNPPKYNKGQRIKIIYDPQQPKSAKIDSWDNIWLSPIILTGVGLTVFIVSGLPLGWGIYDKLSRSKDLHQDTDNGSFSLPIDIDLSSLIALGLGGFSLIFLTIGTTLLVSINSFLKNSISTQATIIDSKTLPYKDSEGRSENLYYPVVKFTTNSGEPQVLELTKINQWERYNNGQTIALIYDPQEPLSAEIAENFTSGFFWVFIIQGLIGLAISGTLVFRKYFVKSGRKASLWHRSAKPSVKQRKKIDSVGMLFLGIGIIPTAIGIIWIFNLRSSLARMVSTQATIIESVKGSPKIKNGKIVGYWYSPKVKFVTSSGETRILELTMGTTNPEQYSKDSEITILYDPQDPKSATIDYRENIWTFPAIPIGIGSVFMLIGGSLIVIHFRKQK